MGNLLQSLLGSARANETLPISITNWARQFRPGQQVVYNGRPHQAFQMNGSANGAVVERNSVVFAVQLRRTLVFSEARFQYQQLRNGRAGDLFGTAALALLEEPWKGAQTRDLLVRAELDVATAGNSFWVEDPDQPGLVRLEPARTHTLTEAVLDPVTGFRIGERLLGYVNGENKELTYYPAEDVAHYRPIPHPTEQFIGMSWLNPCLPDVEADQVITDHKLSQLRRGGNLGYVVSLDASIDSDQFEDFVDQFRRDHEGPGNSGKTLFLGGGADVKTVGQSFVDLALKATQGAGETRIAACGGVHPVVVGLSEGMQGSSLNAGNYGAAKRNFVDGTMRPHWGAFAGAFQSLLPKVTGARLWYDDRDIPFLREDVLDQAEVTAKDAITARTLIDAGFKPDAVVAAVAAGDLSQLAGNHSGFYSVQLQAIGANAAGDQGGATS